MLIKFNRRYWTFDFCGFWSGEGLPKVSILASGILPRGWRGSSGHWWIRRRYMYSVLVLNLETTYHERVRKIWVDGKYTKTSKYRYQISMVLMQGDILPIWNIIYISFFLSITESRHNRKLSASNRQLYINMSTRLWLQINWHDLFTTERSNEMECT